MSDSDDTDLLLLIPPDYYCKDLVEAAQNLFKEKMDAAMPPPPTVALAPTTAAYQFLPQNKKTELNNINVHLQNLRNGDDIAVGGVSGGDCFFAAPSDISTISTSTVRTQLGNKKTRELHGVVHSTPKSGGNADDINYLVKRGSSSANDGILHEIDNYLDEQNRYNGVHNWQHHSDDYRRDAQYPVQDKPCAISLPNGLNRPLASKPNSTPTVGDNKLISLSEIWGKSGQGSAVSATMITPTQFATLKEEQLRRQHLEKTVQSLQSQLLEYQQRISVAIEVDRTKDSALEKTQQENKSLNYEVQHLRDTLHKLEADRQEFSGRADSLQRELSQAVSLATKFQEKNEKLEQDIAAYTRKTNESCNQQKLQLEALELQVHGSKRAEECANNELQKLKDKYAKVEYQNEKLKTRNEEMEKEVTTLRHQKEMLQEYHQKQKTRADTLEIQRKSMQDALSNLTETETTLKKKLETQQKALKSHYQQQLENVVAQKLREFQEQLDKNEEYLKSEARERERLIAERAVKQLEMINEKNEVELNLLQEKQNEEVELYRLQLANAAKKIEDLELKLDLYKSKRADIAEKLHGVMETQWRKALEILTSPNQTGQTLLTDTESDSPEHNAQHYQTPKTSKTQRSLASNSTEKNNLDTGDKENPASPMDKLQAYIELLLSKSPSDLDKLDEILALTSKHKTTAGKLNKTGKHATGKPPWKS